MISAVPAGRKVSCSTVTQDCAALVLGYSRFSLRENERWLFQARGSAKLVDD